MNLQKNKATIVNASVGGGWYPQGSKRLVKSLNYVGWGGETHIWYDSWPNKEFNRNSNYHVKCAAISEVIKQKYTHILWVDCSVWALQDPMPIFDIINKQGYYFWASGYNAAQTTSDKALEYFGVDRDTAETYKDCSTSIFGVNLTNPLGKEFMDRWLQSAKDGAFEGSRFHDGQSNDERFLFDRQDQSCASIIIGKMGLKMEDPKINCQYWDKNMDENIIFTLRGM